VPTFESLGLTTIINAVGPATTLGASRVSSEVAAAMADAARTSIDIIETQGQASAIIATATGAQAGIVTSGASAGLLLGAAAIIARFDVSAMDRLPDTSEVRHEFIVPRSHRNSYDHAVRATGARFVEVGYGDHVVGVGRRATDRWELEAAVSDRTAGFYYVARPGQRPSLSDLAAVAHEHGLPVLVDAAGELPPTLNLRQFIDAGADLAAFSGGKALGGPMASGILCGRRDLVASALLQQLDMDYDSEHFSPPTELFDKSELIGIPRHGIGRSCKVGKEQIVGLLVALGQFVDEGNASRTAQSNTLAHAIFHGLVDVPCVSVRLVPDVEGRGVTHVDVLPEASARQVADRLYHGSPSIRVDSLRVDEGVIGLVPTCLEIGDVPTIRDGFLRALQAVE
jgi:D-glucosaminate-6-phosphate ammonia-lyase